jgi:Na+/H+ antiporter NhaD/arsenite permease-like protein
MITVIALAIFIAGYIGITLEHNLRVNKSAFALAIGGLLWVLVAYATHDSHYSDELIHTGAEIFELVMFLLAAMSLVEVLVHYQFFDLLKAKITQYNLNDKKQFLILNTMTFFLSGIVDNLTITIVMIYMAKQFFKGENLLHTAAAIVISANAGGAFSPIGDVTTIMLWLAGKFTASQIIFRGFMPSFTMFAVSTAIIYRNIINGNKDTTSENIKRLSRSEILVVVLAFGSFGLPLAMSYLSLPPYIGLLLGLGIVWLATDFFKQVSKQTTHLEVSLEKLIQKTDIASLKFFVGILLAASALNQLGILQDFAGFIFGESPNFTRIAIGNTILGLLSSIIGNVPLTAIAIKMFSTPVSSLWILLAITVGTGSSLLVIGSAAGVMAMSLVKELNFTKYAKIAFIPVILGYIAAVVTWAIQLKILGTA